MKFIKEIKAQSPDPALKQSAKQQKYGQAQLARLAHLNEIGDQTEEGLQLSSSRIADLGSSASIPSVSLHKTSTQVTYPDGIILQGYKLIGGMLLTGASSYSEPQCTLQIPSPDGGTTAAGFYLAYSTGGSVKALQTAAVPNFEAINSFASGADMAKTTGVLVQSDYMGLFLDDTATTGDFVVTLQAQTGDSAAGTAEIFYQFEFLVYSTSVPSIS
tara:strand:- start:1576 stop:2223 length:648 start_codon:yes stop_codon:yes gene_type:complete